MRRPMGGGVQIVAHFNTYWDRKYLNHCRPFGHVSQ